MQRLQSGTVFQLNLPTILHLQYLLNVFLNLILTVDRSVSNICCSSAPAIYHNFMIDLWRDTSRVLLLLLAMTIFPSETLRPIARQCVLGDILLFILLYSNWIKLIIFCKSEEIINKLLKRNMF